jgi:hypothetical protein
METLIRWYYMIRLRALQIALHDADVTNNRELARRIAPQEALLRSELERL